MYLGPAIRGEQLVQLPSQLPPSPGESSSGADVKSVIQTIIRRRRVFFSIFVAFVSLVILWTLVVPRSYTATTLLIAGTPSGGGRAGDTTLPLLNALLAASATQSAETYVSLIQEDPVLKQVITDLHLKMGTQKLLNHLDVKPVTNTAIIQLSATFTDPQTAAKIANDLANVFVTRERDLIAGQAGSALDFLTKQLPIAEATMHKADNALARFEAAHPSVYINANSTSLASDNAVSSAQQKFAVTQVDVGQAQAQLDNVTGQMASMSRTVNGQSNISQNPVVSQLQTQLAQVSVQLEAARKQFTEQHPTVIGLEEQKAQLEKEIRSQPTTYVAGHQVVPNPLYQQLKSQAATLQSTIASDQAQLAALGSEIGSTPGSQNLP